MIKLNYDINRGNLRGKLQTLAAPFVIPWVNQQLYPQPKRVPLSTTSSSNTKYSFHSWWHWHTYIFGHKVKEGGDKKRTVACILFTTSLAPHGQWFGLIIKFKGAVQDCFKSPHCTANRLQHYIQVARAQSCTNHMQQVERLSQAKCATCHVVRGDSSAIKFDRV